METDTRGCHCRQGGRDSRQALPSGVLMRNLDDACHLVSRRDAYGGAGAAAIDGAAREMDGSPALPDVSKAGPAVRLSPVELRNREMINDPALEGFCREGRRGGNVAGAAPASLAVRDAKPTRLENVVADHLFIAGEIEEVECGPRRPQAAVGVEVEVGHPLFSTDGAALFDRDGTTLLSLLVPRGRYEVPWGVKAIGPRAFDSHGELRSISLPPTLETVGRLAFAKTGLECMVLPGSVTSIGEKAFYGCRFLRECMVPEGLASMGEQAFALSALEQVTLPSSLQSWGAGAFNHTPAQQRAQAGAIRLHGGNGRYRLDRFGGLYREAGFAELLSNVQEYWVEPGTREILPGAFRRHGSIRAIHLAEGLKSVGDEAFRGARNLWMVDLPDGVESVGDRAFMDTAIQRLRIPASLASVGESALLVQGENPLRASRPLRHVEVEPGNKRFYEDNGILCERGAGDGGKDKALLYLGPDTRVRIPDAVNRIAPFAFLGADGIEELFVHDHLHSICEGAFSVARSIPRVHVDFPKPVDGVLGGSYLIPSLSSRYRTFTHLLHTNADGTAFNFAYYDSWLSHATAMEEFAPAALERLRHPVCLAPAMAEIYRGIFERKQAAVCRHFAKQGDLDALADLGAMGLLSAAVVEQELEWAMGQGNAQATAVLLELGRRRGGTAALDLSL